MDGEDVCLSSVSGIGEKHHSGDEDAALKSVFERQMPATGQPFTYFQIIRINLFFLKNLTPTGSTIRN